MFRAGSRRFPRIIAGFVRAGVVAACFSGIGARAAAEPRPLWSFHAGAPLAGPPAVGADGTVAVGTVDGYVHAFRADGVFRYSYTVAGRVVASPVVLDDGLVLAASDRNRLYAINPDGSLAWESTVAGGVVSPLAPDVRGRVWLRTGSGTAIAMSRRGGVVGFAKIGRAMTLGPTPLANGWVVVGSPVGELGLIGDFGKFRKISAAPALSGLKAFGAGFLALRARSLSEYGPDLEVKWARNEVDGVLCTRPLVTFESGALRWLAVDGGVSAEVAVSGTLAEPSACDAASVYARDERGSLVRVRQNGEVSRIDASGHALVGLDASRPGALVVAYGDGRVAALKAVP